MRDAIGEERIVQLLSEMITPIASIPEGERAAWFYSLDAFARRAHPDALYNLPKIAATALRIANAVWPEYPPQDDLSRPIGMAPAASPQPPAASEAARG